MRKESWDNEPIRQPVRPMRGSDGRSGRPGVDSNPMFQGGGNHRIIESKSNGIKMGLQEDTTINFVFDFTWSARDILPVIYIFCKDLMQACQAGAGRVRFGVTFLSEEVECHQFKNKAFTTASTDVLDALLTHEVGGGGADGCERLGTAVRSALNQLSAVPPGERVLILFTDSCPSDEDMERVICRDETPIRSAVLFVPTIYSGSEYLFRLVDTAGKTDRSKSAVIFNIEDVIHSRYLKMTTEKNGRLVQEDQVLLRNQLLRALL